MAISRDLLDILICPACRRDADREEKLTMTEAQDALLCGGCKRSYPIRDEIPVLLIDEATLPG